jgi:hypothetical protein
LTVKVPTDTEGVNLTLSCGLGSRQQNTTLQQLYGTNEQDFELETSHRSVLWLAYLTVVMNIAAFVILMMWFLGGRREASSTRDEHPILEAPEVQSSEQQELHTGKNKTF